jgi:very-short-patch-repair endonuclease
MATKAKALMTKREQAMYWRLKGTFPAVLIFAQVAFSALIISQFKHRNRYDRKVAVFLLCDPTMQVQVVIELDDASHRGRETYDAERLRSRSWSGKSPPSSLPQNDVRERQQLAGITHCAIKSSDS